MHFIASADEQTAETVKKLLLSEEARLRLIAGNEAFFTGSKTFVKSRKTKKQFFKEFFGCGDVGHLKRDCTKCKNQKGGSDRDKYMIEVKGSSLLGCRRKGCGW